jgi:hypothetical protein
MDIRFEQRQTHFPHSRINIRGGKFSPLAQSIKNLVKPTGKCLEHGVSSLKKQLPEGGQILAQNQFMVKEYFPYPVLCRRVYTTGN